MSDPRQVREKQAAWQAARKNLSWPEKIRQAEAVRESVRILRGRDAKTAPRHKR